MLENIACVLGEELEEIFNPEDYECLVDIDGKGRVPIVSVYEKYRRTRGLYYATIHFYNSNIYVTLDGRDKRSKRIFEYQEPRCIENIITHLKNHFNGTLPVTEYSEVS